MANAARSSENERQAEKRGERKSRPAKKSSGAAPKAVASAAATATAEETEKPAKPGLFKSAADMLMSPIAFFRWAVPEEKGTLTTWLAGMICLLVFFLAMLGEQYLHGSDGFPELVRRCIGQTALLPGCEDAIFRFHELHHSFSTSDWKLAGVETAKALSVAIGVSIVVSHLFERTNRKRLNDTLTEKARHISFNVFEGLFGNSHPPSALKAIKDMLTIPILRERLDVSYTLSVWNPPPGRPIRGDRKYIQVDVVFSGLTRNIANPKIAQDASHDVKIALSLPNPLVDELKELVRIKSVKINDVPLSAEDLARCNSTLEAAFKLDSNADGHVLIKEHKLQPGEQVRVEALYTMMKELEDTEVFRSFQITEALSLTVIDRTGQNMLINARAIHPGTLHSVGSSDSFLRWELYDIVLPYQGLMVWWKRPLPPLPNAAIAAKTPTGRGTQGAS